MNSSKEGEGKSFNPSVSETVNCILQKQVSCQAIFPSQSAVPSCAARSHKTGLPAGMFKTVSWQSLELCFSSSICFSLIHLRLENLENLDMGGHWNIQKQTLNFTPTASTVCAVVSASLWCTTRLWRSRQWCAPDKSQPHGLCVCSRLLWTNAQTPGTEQGVQSYRIWQWCWFTCVIRDAWGWLRRF